MGSTLTTNFFTRLGAGVLVALQLRRNAISAQLSQEQALQTKQKLVTLVADTPSVAN